MVPGHGHKTKFLLGLAIIFFFCSALPSVAAVPHCLRRLGVCRYIPPFLKRFFYRAAWDDFIPRRYLPLMLTAPSSFLFLSHSEPPARIFLQSPQKVCSFLYLWHFFSSPIVALHLSPPSLLTLFSLSPSESNALNVLLFASCFGFLKTYDRLFIGLI